MNKMLKIHYKSINHLLVYCSKATEILYVSLSQPPEITAIKYLFTIHWLFKTFLF